MEIAFILIASLIILFFLYFKRKTIITLARGDDIKMVLVVRADLNMGKGKIAAQCCHACIGLYKRQMLRDKESIEVWESSFGKKIVVKCDNEKEMFEIAESAENNGFGTYIVCDAGLTQVSPNSNTVLAIGPASDKQLKSITGYLKLL